MPKLVDAQIREEVRKRAPQFNHIRRTLHGKYTPTVHLEIAYKNKETGAIIVVKDTVTPKSKFPPHKYEKIYETATVKVILFN